MSVADVVIAFSLLLVLAGNGCGLFAVSQTACPQSFVKGQRREGEKVYRTRAQNDSLGTAACAAEGRWGDWGYGCQ